MINYTQRHSSYLNYFQITTQRSTDNSTLSSPSLCQYSGLEARFSSNQNNTTFIACARTLYKNCKLVLLMNTKSPLAEMLIWIVESFELIGACRNVTLDIYDTNEKMDKKAFSIYNV